MFTGRVPFLANNPVALAQAVCTQPVFYPSYIPEEAKFLIYQLLRKNPKNRVTMEQIKESPYFKQHFAVYLQEKQQKKLQDKSNKSLQNGVGSMSDQTESFAHPLPKPPPKMKLQRTRTTIVTNFEPDQLNSSNSSADDVNNSNSKTSMPPPLPKRPPKQNLNKTMSVIVENSINNQTLNDNSMLKSQNIENPSSIRQKLPTPPSNPDAKFKIPEFNRTKSPNNETSEPNLSKDPENPLQTKRLIQIKNLISAVSLEISSSAMEKVKRGVLRISTKFENGNF